MSRIGLSDSWTGLSVVGGRWSGYIKNYGVFDTHNFSCNLGEVNMFGGVYEK